MKYAKKIMKNEEKFMQNEDQFPEDIWGKFRDKQIEFLNKLDAIDSKPNDGRVDIDLFNQHYGKYGWEATSTWITRGKGSINTGSVDIEQQATKMANQKFPDKVIPHKIFGYHGARWL